MWLTAVCIFLIAPCAFFFSEAEGLFGWKGSLPRALQALVFWLLFALLVHAALRILHVIWIANIKGTIFIDSSPLPSHPVSPSATSSSTGDSYALHSSVIHSFSLSFSTIFPFSSVIGSLLESILPFVDYFCFVFLDPLFPSTSSIVVDPFSLVSIFSIFGVGLIPSSSSSSSSSEIQ